MRQVFEGLLTELSKVNAPSMLLLDFNYFFNKAVNQYINKRYGAYDISQQTTDDLRVLKATTLLKPTKLGSIGGDADVIKYGAGLSRLFGGTWEVNLPLDYLHMLNCICIYKLNKRFKCYDKGNIVLFAAKRLTADSWSVVINDFYNRPLPERPYYYIHNINLLVNLPTNPIKDTTILSIDNYGTDAKNDYTNSNSPLLDSVLKPHYDIEKVDTSLDNDSGFSQVGGDKIDEAITPTKLLGESNLPRTIDLSDLISNNSVVEREAGVRYGNASNVRCEIRYGHDSSVFELVGVLIDYIKAPLNIRLTQEQVNLTEDTSQIMEFPDYVCQEIINELVHLVMENTADPRLQTHIPVTQSIANPAQQRTPQPQPQQRG